MNPSPPRSERTLLLLVAAVQFVNILDFMMVMPLGPDFGKELGIPTSTLGVIGGSYTAAAAVAGFVGALFLDRFDRRKALGVAMLGLVIGTAAGGFARGLPSLIAARVLAGAFGGPASALSVSIVADAVPAERRGRAMGTVMAAFSVASVLGVPAGLELARLGGWRTPFFAVAGLGLVVAAGAVALMPPMTGHLERAASGRSPLAALGAILGRPMAPLSFFMVFASMASAFSLIPNFSSYFQFNGHFPREGLGLLYLVGGSVSFVAMRVAGPLVDRVGATAVSAVGSALYVLVVTVGCMFGRPLMPPMLFFVGFMVAQSLRNVSMNSTASRVPLAHERASYQSLQSAVQHVASAAGAMLSSRLLSERDDRSLDGMGRVTVLAVVLALVLPPALAAMRRGLARRSEAR